MQKKPARKPNKKTTDVKLSWGKQALKKAGDFSLQSSIPELLLLTFLLLGRTLTNSDFSYPSEIILNLVLLGVLATVFFWIYKKILLARFGLLATHLASLLTTYQLYAFSRAYKPLVELASKILPNLTYFGWTIGVLLLCSITFVAFAALVGWVVQKFAKGVEIPLLKIAVFTIAFICVSQLAKVGARTIDTWQALTYEQPKTSYVQNKAKITSKPNVYYIVFDRYANKQTLQNVYGYDNTPTLDYLASQGMTNREDAYSNYPFTMQSIGSTLRMDYHKDLHKQFNKPKQTFQAGLPYRSFLDNPPVVQELKKNGYRYNVVSSWWDFTRKSPVADNEPTNSYRLRLLGKTFWATDLQRDIVNKSVLAPLLLKGVTIGDKTIVKYDLDRNPETNFRDQIKALKTIASNSATDTQPHVTFAHVLSPHDPYVFLPDGSKAKYDGNRTDNGEDEFIKYTNQLRYVNSQLESLVKTIRSKDPNAVIIMQTDEGPYPKEFRGVQTATKHHNPITLTDQGMRNKFGSFASYYFPDMTNEQVSSEMTNHVNAFRLVLRHYLGYDLPNLPECHYAVGAKFDLYGFKDVTKKVDPTNTSNCKAYL